MKYHKINIRVRLIVIHGEKVLVQYSEKGDFYYYIGGHLEYGETIKGACIREVKEECGDNINFNFRKILYIRDFIRSEDNEHSLELFIYGDIDKFGGLDGYKDPQHVDGTVWLEWLDINNLPKNLLPKTLSEVLLNDYKNGFRADGKYVGIIE